MSDYGKTDSQYHSVTFDINTEDGMPEFFRFTCTAPPDAPCRTYPDCGCEVWGDDHACLDVPNQSCWMIPWWESDDPSMWVGMTDLTPGPIIGIWEDLDYLTWRREGEA